MKALALVNIRSCHNVGSILRTSGFFGFDEVYFIGVTPYPEIDNDTRLPHITRTLTDRINKVSLGAHKGLTLKHFDNLSQVPGEKIALEQDASAITITKFNPPQSYTLVLGEETKGLTKEELELCQSVVEIPKTGDKESLNVSVASGIAMYHFSTVNID